MFFGFIYWRAYNGTARRAGGPGFAGRWGGAVPALKEPQPQGVADHRHAAQAHGCGGEHGVELPLQQGEEYARRQGDAQGVVEKRPKQILLDIPDGGPAEKQPGILCR